MKVIKYIHITIHKQGVNDYIKAGQDIEANKNNLGWLYLCCESKPSYSKCVGCQQANIFNILCGWVYPPLKTGLQAGGVTFPAQSVIGKNIAPVPQITDINDKNTMYLFSIQFIAIGVIIGVLLMLSCITIVYFVTKFNNNNTKTKHHFDIINQNE